MSHGLETPLVAIDVGNSTISGGYFSAAARPLPYPVRHHCWPTEDNCAALSKLIPPGCTPQFAIASVNGAATRRIIAHLSATVPEARPQVFTTTDFPVQVDLPRPQGVGSDRLAAAVAANAARSPARTAIVIDAGTAITVDAVDADGVFLGGVILPGVKLIAKALCEGTELLPHVHFETDHAAPAIIGKDTGAAIRSGLYYGTIGAVREVVSRTAQMLKTEPELFVTGGFGQVLASALSSADSYVPHLVLAGIAITARTDSSERSTRGT